MNQNYKFKSLQFSKKEGKQKEISDEVTVYETGETRTIDFKLQDGTRQNFTYAHYITAWIGKDKDAVKNERFIKIFFATHLITIMGYCLDELYNAIIDFSVKSITANNERYLDKANEGRTFVTKIEIKWKST